MQEQMDIAEFVLIFCTQFPTSVDVICINLLVDVVKLIANSCYEHVWQLQSNMIIHAVSLACRTAGQTFPWKRVNTNHRTMSRQSL